MSVRGGGSDWEECSEVNKFHIDIFSYLLRPKI